MSQESFNIENKNTKGWVTLRIKKETKTISEDILKKANDKKTGKKVKPDDLIHFALGLVTTEHIKTIQKRSITHSDRKAALYQLYIQESGQSTWDDFEGFTMTPDWLKFLKKHHKLMAID